jgi:hypothetical protein
MKPLERFKNLILIDKQDIYQIFLYSIIAGLISLSLPLGIQSIINFIQAGKVSTSWIVLVFVVVIGVALYTPVVPDVKLYIIIYLVNLKIRSHIKIPKAIALKAILITLRDCSSLINGFGNHAANKNSHTIIIGFIFFIYLKLYLRN